ncbi:F-box/kelch-repeat protein At3g27150-like [Durio zibethinus]|uniref:F-box/kelch-repeat protein At3g27150-like n=1 Tax=Durio zibethinus TaxID=66656 RepID=A0A6P6BEH9_DURZI|nr:F-box/kelch-repeat protein At3g27150-like [Durio zibethinus]
MAEDSFHMPPRQKIKICKAAREANPNPNHNGFSSSRSSFGDSSGVEPQDADYSYFPQLSDELENLILARFPRSEFWKLYLLNKHYLNLLKSGELFKIRREIGFKESSIFMSPIGGNCWWAFDRLFKSCRKLPVLPSSDVCFISGDKESICAGSHLIVSGRETEGSVVWRFELETSKWFKGPSMIDPRCLFASATCGSFAFVAGGIGMDSKVLNSAEKYNPEAKSWELLPRMHQMRKLCSGCFMDNKFYVIGGRDEKDMELTSGEAYDKDKNTWEWIPDMLKDDTPVATRQSPPLVAVVNNELYCLETSSNQLRVYLKSCNTWKSLGAVPVRADIHRGWGVAFKSLGKELLVIGLSSSVSSGGMTIYTCTPQPDTAELQWRCIEGCKDRLNFFLLNCSVMAA